MAVAAGAVAVVLPPWDRFGYNVQLSVDGTTWGQPVAQGAGQTPTTIVMLRQTPAKAIRITQTGTAANGELWAIQQVRIYEARR